MARSISRNCNSRDSWQPYRQRGIYNCNITGAAFVATIIDHMINPLRSEWLRETSGEIRKGLNKRIRTHIHLQDMRREGWLLHPHIRISQHSCRPNAIFPTLSQGNSSQPHPSSPSIQTSTSPSRGWAHTKRHQPAYKDKTFPAEGRCQMSKKKRTWAIHWQNRHEVLWGTSHPRWKDTASSCPGQKMYPVFRFQQPEWRI